MTLPTVNFFNVNNPPISPTNQIIRNRTSVVGYISWYDMKFSCRCRKALCRLKPCQLVHNCTKDCVITDQRPLLAESAHDESWCRRMQSAAAAGTWPRSLHWVRQNDAQTNETECGGERGRGAGRDRAWRALQLSIGDCWWSIMTSRCCCCCHLLTTTVTSLLHAWPW